MHVDPGISKLMKRKERKKKVKPSAKKIKNVARSFRTFMPVLGEVKQQSRSLAERARREKINARMKLLQELVPGCNKISGTAMVLDLVSCFKILSSLSLLQELKQQRQKKDDDMRKDIEAPKSFKKPEKTVTQESTKTVNSEVILPVKEEADINGPKSFKKVKLLLFMLQDNHIPPLLNTFLNMVLILHWQVN